MTIHDLGLKIFKRRRIAFVLPAVALAGAALLVLFLRTGNQKAASPPVAGPPSQRMAIGGLSFFGISDGRKSIAIRADRFVIEKKKFGFLSFSLMNVARLENAVIDVYGVSRSTAETSSIKSPDMTAAPDGRGGKAPTFDHILSRESFSLFPVKNIGAITAAPVVVQFHDDRGFLTRLSAMSGTIRMKEQDILFSGNVRVASGPRELLTDQLLFLPQKGLFDVNKSYTMKTAGNRYQGKHLTTDIYLKRKQSEDR